MKVKAEDQRLSPPGFHFVFHWTHGMFLTCAFFVFSSDLIVSRSAFDFRCSAPLSYSTRLLFIQSLLNLPLSRAGWQCSASFIRAARYPRYLHDFRHPSTSVPWSINENGIEASRLWELLLTSHLNMTFHLFTTVLILLPFPHYDFSAMRLLTSWRSSRSNVAIHVFMTSDPLRLTPSLYPLPCTLGPCSLRRLPFYPSTKNPCTLRSPFLYRPKNLSIPSDTRTPSSS